MFFGSEPAQPRMRAAGVEVPPPGLEDLAGVTADQMKDVVIAYEPVWAIGTLAARIFL